MKTRLLIILLVLSILFPTSNIFAPPSPNEWPSAPYCPGGCSFDHMKQRWSEYYNYKGSKWMEIKKQEMFASVESGTLDEWLDEPTMAHNNVRTYYFYQGEVPNHDGKFLNQVVQERFFFDMEQNLKNNQFPLGGHMSINFAFLLVITVGGIIGTIFVIRRKRK
jgi:hypothetical protein